VRIAYKLGGGHPPQLTKRGISLLVSKLPALIAALQKAEVEARARGLIAPEPSTGGPR
jgi:hypothetical protein